MNGKVLRKLFVFQTLKHYVVEYPFCCNTVQKLTSFSLYVFDSQTSYVILEIPSTVARDSFSNVKEKEYSLVVGELGGLSSLISHYLFIYFIWFFIHPKKEKKEKKKEKETIGANS